MHSQCGAARAPLLAAVSVERGIAKHSRPETAVASTELRSVPVQQAVALLFCSAAAVSDFLLYSTSTHPVSVLSLIHI